MNKLETIVHDPNHPSTWKPAGEMFDNNHLFYLYCKWSIDKQYDEARIYMWENFEQILWQSKQRSFLDLDLYDEIKSQMYMLADWFYISIFEDENVYHKQVWVKSRWSKIPPEWEIESATKFERYYLPQQVYWYLKTTIYYKIITLLNNQKKSDEQSVDIFNMTQERDCDMLADNPMDDISLSSWVQMLLPKINNFIWEKLYIFVSVFLNQKSLKTVSKEINDVWGSTNKQKVFRTVQEITKELRDYMDQLWLKEDDFLHYN